MSLSTKSDTEELLSASADAVYLWDMVQYRQRRMLGSVPYGSCQAVFSPAGNIIAAASPKGSVVVRNAKSLHQILEFDLPQGQRQQRFVPSCLSISPDEKWLLVGCQCPALLLLYSLQQRKLHHALQLPEDMWTVVQAQLLPDSSSAAGMFNHLLLCSQQAALPILHAHLQGGAACMYMCTFHSTLLKQTIFF